MTSAPLCAASAATTLLSTPPDMATTMRADLGPLGRSKFGDMAGIFTPNSPCPARGCCSARREEGRLLSKYDGEIRAVAEVSGDLDELLSALGRPPRPD